jgi:uncharacterized protein DUF4123/type III secretion system (T3SS) inner membrane Yop/YscD-like protein
LIVDFVAAPGGARKLLLEAGRTAFVGRAERADLPVVNDPRMAPAHFSLAWDGTTCVLADLKSDTGTLLNGGPVERADVRHGDWIRAGNTDFRVFHEGFTQRERDSASPASRDAVLRLLRGSGAPIFAVLDAARSRRIVQLLQESANEHRSLYDGIQGETFAWVAPYVVEFASGPSPLLESLVHEGWAQSWGVYFTSAHPFGEVRRHLRRFLMVNDPAGKPMYFRFYDPRVLARFLPLCTQAQLDELFERVGRFVAEGQGGEAAHVFQASPGRSLEHEIVKLTP